MDMFETTFPERLLPRTYDESGKLLTSWDEDAGWFEDGMEQTEYGDWRMTRIFHPYTEAQLLSIRMEKEKAALTESRRELTLDEVVAIFLKNQVNTVDIPDQTSLRMKRYYPDFKELIGQTVPQGFKFIYNDDLYKTVQSGLTIQEHYPPGVGTENLYTRIDLVHTGAIYDPIPYQGNMELFNGKYYSQNGVIYLCNRDTAAPVYHALIELVGIYVEKV